MRKIEHVYLKMTDIPMDYGYFNCNEIEDNYKLFKIDNADVALMCFVSYIWDTKTALCGGNISQSVS